MARRKTYLQNAALLLLPAKQRFVAEVCRVHRLVRHGGICARCAESRLRNGGFVDAGKTDAVEVNSGSDIVDDGRIVFLERNGLKADFLGWFGGTETAEVECGLVDLGSFDEVGSASRTGLSGCVGLAGLVDLA